MFCVSPHAPKLFLYFQRFWQQIINTHIKKKGKVHPRTCHEGPQGEYRYSSTLSFTLVLDGGGWLTTRPGRFTPGKRDSVPIVQEAGWAPGPVWMGAENHAPLGLNPHTVQPIVSRYTNYAIPADVLHPK
jgi:hypothetical protein